MKFYYPYKSDRPNKKYFIITNDNKKVYFGASGYEDYTQHKNPLRKIRYIQRHQKKEGHLWNKSGINTPSFWSYFLLWNKSTIKESYNYIKQNFF